jgi:ACT domain-containing protein
MIMAMKEEYTFVTLDSDVVTTGDAVFVDIDDTINTDMDFVQIDDSYDVDFQVEGVSDDSSDFITLDDMDMINDFDIDTYSSDINEVDVSII